MNLDRRKLVSHRLRGFGPYENCRTALQLACVSAVPCLEIDTRVAADGRIFVYHNPRGTSYLKGRPHFAQLDSAAVRAAHYPSGERLLELDEALGIFSRRRCSDQRLCIDIKDVGFELQHLELTRRYGVEPGVSWLSWVPETLVRLRDLGASGPLILAHCNLLGLSALGDWLGGALSGASIRMSHLVLQGVDHARTMPRLAHGFQHSMLCTRLPRPIERLLAESGGGVCVHRRLVSWRLADYCREAGLQLWVYRVGTAAGYARYAADHRVSMVCCDDAPGVLQAAGAARSSPGAGQDSGGLADQSAGLPPCTVDAMNSAMSAFNCFAEAWLR